MKIGLFLTEIWALTMVAVAAVVVAATVEAIKALCGRRELGPRL